ncbi:DMSO/TMAO reductase YedYZ molybdopterin-dependent catalytic subunit [Spinactinospora alkalitolerans]|uniref:DMSO/TMAO reductase YedYZ molybdopterin-dependent catalytic subunit n=1 Tax=Spinactinospora alkalitolerans TaxID=687207 RepID=A0A852TXJ9_9ACTN|nr:molybdopterin-dependent oxidoreductase [Spinactinospora alkalitolerans]NYE46764.1 DMSO/TMAO reductase YedYZ molybdopterin-dependent catalytic subunit [Spinactinospora alkalitolerans]
MTDHLDDRSSQTSPPRLVDALCGVLAACAALAAAELAAPLIAPGAAPLLVVGGAVIDLTPPPLKDFAVEAFGTADKPVLLGGMAVVLAAFAALIGVAGRRRRRLGAVGIALFALIGAVAALSRPDGTAVDVLPSVAGGLVAAAVLWLLLEASRPRRAGPAPEGGSGGGGAPDGASAPAAGDAGAGAASRAGGAPGFDRRRFVLLAGATATLSAGAGFAGHRLSVTRVDTTAVRAAIRLPRPASPAPPLPDGVDLEIAGLAPFFTANEGFYRIDTALSVPRIDATAWRLRVHGRGVTEREYAYDDLLNRSDLIERDITLACVSNPVGGEYIGNARWIGVPLAALLREAGVRAPAEGGAADQIVSRSSDGMTIGTPVADVLDGRDAMLALGMNGVPLPVEHGFPVRMVVPGLYGYVSACKWLVEMELTTFGAFDAYWVPRGWSAKGPIKTQSRIDTPRAGGGVGRGRVTVAGVAWAQHVGVDRVEVRVDDEPWQQARLSEEDTADTWRQWLMEWEAAPGEHTLQVRATDRSGRTQTAAEAPPAPDGATGLHTVTVTVT